MEDNRGNDTLVSHDGCGNNIIEVENKFVVERAEGDTIVVDNVEELRSLTEADIQGLLTGVYKSVKLLGYYQKGDTPNSIDYYYSTTTEGDDGGSVFEVGGIKLAHEFAGAIDARYYGVFGDTGEDVVDRIITMVSSLKENTIVTFDSGGHIITKYVDITVDNITFKGSKNTHFVQQTDYTNAFLSTNSNFTILDITIFQTGKSKETDFPHGYGAGVVFYKVKSGLAKNLRIYNAGDHTNTDPDSISGAGVYRSSSDNVIVDNCEFYFCRMGVNDDDYLNKPVGDPDRKTCNYNDILNSYFEDCWFGVNIDYGGPNGGIDFIPGIIDNCKFKRVEFGKSAIESKKFQCRKPLVVNNPQITGRWAQAIAFLFGSYYDKIEGGYIDGAYYGIVLYQQPGQEPTRYVSVNNMTIRNCLNIGVSNISSYDCTISNCEISNNKYGVVASSFTWNLSLLNNNINRNTHAGVKLDEVLGCTILGGEIINNSTISSGGSQSGIIVNEPNTVGRITGLTVRNVTFDYSFTSGTPTPSTNQLYAIKTVGNYYTFNAQTSPGIIERNFFGRCGYSESQPEGANTALIYRGNIQAGQRYNDFNQRINISSRKIVYGNGSPNGVLVGSPGDIYVREDIAENPIYFKELTTDNQNWVPQNSFISKRITDLNSVTGYVVLRTTDDCLNAPSTGYFQGIQYSANNSTSYLNQVVYDISGNCFERTKNNDVWTSWVARDSAKYDLITTASITIFSGSRNQIVVQNSPSNLTNPVSASPYNTRGLYKKFKNVGSGNMVLQLASGVTVNGSSSNITLITGENLTIVSTGVNTYITLDRYFDGVPAYSTKPTLGNGERRMIIDTTTNKPLWGLGTSGATEWRDATGSTV